MIRFQSSRRDLSAYHDLTPEQFARLADRPLSRWRRLKFAACHAIGHPTVIPRLWSSQAALGGTWPEWMCPCGGWRCGRPRRTIFRS